jgi:hypothetical protein
VPKTKTRKTERFVLSEEPFCGKPGLDDAFELELVVA